MISGLPLPYLVTLLEMGRQRFLHGLECVPEERLHWSVGDSCHTPLQLAGRVSGFLDYRSRALSSAPGVAVPRSAPSVPATREEARSQVDEAFRRLMYTVEQLTEEDLEQPVPAPWGGEMPKGLMLMTAVSVIGYFQGQFNYCQLSYGDLDPNIPPEWRPFGS